MDAMTGLEQAYVLFANPVPMRMALPAEQSKASSTASAKDARSDAKKGLKFGKRSATTSARSACGGTFSDGTPARMYLV